MSTLEITRVAHATLLLSFDGHVILVDPWFSEKSGAKRCEPLGMSISALPKLGGLFISHDHFDHCDWEALAQLPDKSLPVVACQEMAASLVQAGFTRVTGLAPSQTAQLGPVQVLAAVARHPAPQITCVLSGLGLDVFYGGDSLFVPELASVGKRFRGLDVALLPVACAGRGAKATMGPEEAAGLCAVLEPRVAVPIHYGLCASADQAREMLAKFRGAARIFSPKTETRVLAPGQSLRVKGHKSA